MNNDKIDIVVSWLDDTDKIWQHAFEKHALLEYKAVMPNFVNTSVRFRSYDTFKYWFRGAKQVHLG